jgi:hypothetical protein
MTNDGGNLMAVSTDGEHPFAIVQRGARYWVSVYREVPCAHAHPSAISATRCGRRRRRDVEYDRLATTGFLPGRPGGG